MIFGVGLLIGGAIILKQILPWIIGLLANTVTALFLIIAVVALVAVMLDKRFWNLLWYFYKSAMRAATSVFITIDPIGIMKNYVSDLRSQAANMAEQIANLRGQMVKLKQTIDTNEKDRVKNLDMAGEAQKRNMQGQFMLTSRKAGRLGESNMTLKELFTKLEVMYRVLNKMYETSGIVIDDIEDTVRVKTMERNSIQAGYSAVKSAMRIISGDKDKKELFDQTMEYLADDYGKKVGEIEQFMEMSKGVIDGIDLTNATYEADALNQLAAWEKKSDTILLGDQKAVLIADAYNPSSKVDLRTPEKELEPVSVVATKKGKSVGRKMLD
jgi:predicted HicB family RNase H-like nuclease